MSSHQTEVLDTLIGRTIGNYVVRKKVGQGGMGAVYLAEHPRIGRQVAIKVLLPELSKNPQVVQRFFTEAKSSSEIRNQHIIDILDFGELSDGLSYIIMEWLEGQSLRDALRAGKFDLDRAVHIAIGIGRALGSAHARGIVHRDLKPDNIFLIPRGDDPDFVKVLDFGIAKLMQQEESAHDIKTQTGALIGTPAYMSPEQCRGQAVDQRTDIYALGVIMYNMFTGKQPFIAEGLGELLLAHMTQVPTALRQIEPEIPEVLEHCVAHALEKDPGARYQRIEELLVELGDTSAQAALGDGPPVVRRHGSTGPQPTFRGGGNTNNATKLSQARRGSALFLGIGAAVLLGSAAFIVPKLLHGHPDTPPIVIPLDNAEPKTDPKIVPKSDPKSDPHPATSVHLIIHTEPATALITVDDAPVSNPFTGSFPKSDVRHHVMARATGYQNQAQWLAFDTDHELTMTLLRAPAIVPHEQVRHDHETKVDATNVAKPDVKSDGKPVYKGTKGKLITEFPE